MTDGVTKLQELKFLLDAKRLETSQARPELVKLPILGLLEQANSSSLSIKGNPEAWASLLNTIGKLKEKGVEIDNIQELFKGNKPKEDDLFWASEDGTKIKELLNKIGA